MKERPILMSAPMVRALLREVYPKTQTRRVMNPQPQVIECPEGFWEWKQFCWDSLMIPVGDYESPTTECPYGVPGDRLWVKETSIITPNGWDNSPTFTCRDHEGNKRWVQYLATSPNTEAAKDYGLKVSPSIFMPRWASRITLEIADVRVQRVQEISEEDARAEGCEGVPFSLTVDHRKLDVSKGERSYRADFCGLWDSISLKRGHGWDKNDWVWAITFKRLAQ